jgi:TLD
MYFRWLLILQMNLILVLVLIFARIGEGFSVRSNNDGRKRSSLNLSRNFLSIITGLPPQALLDEESLKDILQTTSLQGKSLQCAYKATRNGWSATDFHDAVDDLGSGLVVALSRSGALFGGFNPLGWRSTDDYFNSNSAFLWYTTGAKKVVKTPILQGGEATLQLSNFDYTTLLYFQLICLFNITSKLMTLFLRKCCNF